jgi:hypothetical protein
MRRELLPKVKAPTFKVHSCTLNEYELRQLQIDVAKKEIKGNIKVKCVISGQIFNITEDGSLDMYVKGMNISDDQALELFMIQNGIPH